MKKHFRIAGDLGVCDSNRIAHRGGIARFRATKESSGFSRGAPHGVATLKARKGAFDALKKGSGPFEKVK